MGYRLTTKKISDGVNFNSIIDDRYKTNKISVNFILQLESETAAKNALIPKILDKSSEDYPDFTMLNKKLDELYGASIGGGVTKLGDYQIVTLGVSSIDDQFALNNESITEELSKILAGIAFKPLVKDNLFDLKTFEVEKQNLIDLINSEINEKRSFAISRTESILGEGTPYGVNKLGDIDSANKLTNDVVYDAYKAMVKTAGIEIMFIGCGDSKPAFDVFESVMSNINREYNNSLSSPIAEITNEVKEVTDRYDIAQSKLVLGFKTGQKTEDIDAFRVMTALYGGTPVSKLFVNVREKMSLCYYCAARYDRVKGVILVDSGVETANVEKAKAEILNQLEEIKKGNITDEELVNTKLSLKNRFKTTGDSASGLEAWYLVQRIFATENDPEDEAQKVDLITKEDIMRVANLVTLDTVYLLTEKEGEGR